MLSNPNQESAAALVGMPAWPVREVAARVARPIHQGGPHRGLVLTSEDVYLGSREVRKAAGMVEIEVGDGDVAHVGGVVSELADLLDGRLAGLGPDPEPSGEREAEPPVGVAGVVEPHAGVDEDQRIRRLDQQAVADDAGPAALP